MDQVLISLLSAAIWQEYLVIVYNGYKESAFCTQKFV